MSSASTSLNSQEFRRQLQELQQSLGNTMVRDRLKLRRELREMQKRLSEVHLTEASLPFDQLKNLQRRFEKSKETAVQRQATKPICALPAELPISQRADEIRELLQSHQVVVIAGETGSGKTTQLPKICLEAGRGIFGKIGHTQPRRLAARSVAQRIAQELKVNLGDQVGYQVRFTDQVGDNTLIKLMTDGILLAETQRDRFLDQYDTLIIDEAHERSLNIDFLLGYIKRILPKRPDLKVIITSATIDLERFSRHFDNAPVLEVSGRTFPVEVRYQPLISSDVDTDVDSGIQQAILKVLDEIDAEERRHHRLPGDILVFLVGEREIRETALFLRQAQIPNLEILPLYARLSAEEQARVFHSHAGRRIVLATNVAETSLTVPGIRYVIDPGLARISRYSYRSKVQRLPVEPVSQASANQRKGRCGRVSEGICYRLYDEQDFLTRTEFTDAEIQRTNLASVILQMLNLRLGNIEDFPFVDAPDNRFINDGYKLLEELGAVDDKRQLTPLGRKMGRIPADPRIARILIEGAQRGALQETLIIASALSVQDPWERPQDKQQAADERHAAWRDKDSDFVSVINLWKFYEENRQSLTANQLKAFCKKQFLSYLRMREWRDVHRQLHLIGQEIGLTENQQPANYESIHRAILAGFVTQIGALDERGDFLSTRSRKFRIFPGSALFKKPPRWVLAAEIVETSKVYARTAARIEPEWVEQAASNLIKRTYLEPHWEKKRGEVVAYEQISLYGVVLVAKRPVGYSKIEPALSRELFIRHALVEGEFETRAEFFHENQKRIEEVDSLEVKSRRRDFLVDPETLFQFYDERIPAEIVSRRHFDSWYKALSQTEKDRLILQREDVLRVEDVSSVEEQFPDFLIWQGAQFRLSYRFEPGHPEDGVSVRVPLHALKQLPVNRLEWLVPGLLRDKCIALVKALPKQWRRNFVPVPDFVNAALDALVPQDEPLTEQLGQQLQRMTGVRIPHDAWSDEAIEAHLRMNIQVLDSQDRLLAQGRDYHSLVATLGSRVEASARPSAGIVASQKGLRDWSFGPLAEVIEVEQGGTRTLWYPALVDHGDSVELTAFVDSRQALEQSRRGIARLAMLALGQQVKYLHKHLPNLQSMGLYYAPVGQLAKLLDDLLLAVFRDLFVADNLPRNSAEFAQRLDERRGQLIERANDFAGAVHDALKGYHDIAKRLKGKIQLALALNLTEVQRQLDHLVYPGFLIETPPHWLAQYGRYFRALERRLEKMALQMARERLFIGAMDAWWQDYQRRKEKLEQQAVYDEELVLFRWMLEEYRVSYFAQELGTTMPISEKRLERQWEKVRR